MSLLEIEDLRIVFGRRRKVAVDGVSFTLGERERLGIIGQSGSGKTVIALSIMGLLPARSSWGVLKRSCENFAVTRCRWSSRNR